MYLFFVLDNQEQKFPQTASVQTFPLKLLLDDEDVLSLLRYFLCAMLLKQAHFSSSGVFLSISTRLEVDCCDMHVPALEAAGSATVCR